MGDWIKGYTLALTETGDSAYSSIANKMDPEVTTIYTHLNNLKKTFYGAMAPSDPSEGQPWWDSTNGIKKRYIGGTWVEEYPIVPLGAKAGGDLKVDTAGSVVKIEPGYREVGGKWYHWNSELNFTIGPSGSNSSSDAVPTSAQLVYLYIDASVLPSSQNTELTAANFISKSTAPSYDATKHGWYDGDDRCIGALWHDGTDLIVQEKRGQMHTYYTYDLIEIITTNLNAIVTFTHVPGGGMAIGVCGWFRVKHSTAADLGVAVYHTDGSNDIGPAFDEETQSVLKMYVQPFVFFLYPHNKLRVYMPRSDTRAQVYTKGFIYHDTI